MFTKAYFLISLAREFCQCQDDYQEVVRDLEAVPEVRSIEPVVGVCDLMVQVEAPIRAIFVADKIMPKEWVKRLVVLKVQPFQFDRDSRPGARELLRAQIALTKETKNRVERRV